MSPPIVAVSIPYPGASPDTGRARGRRSDRGGRSRRSAASSRSRRTSLDSFGVITVEFVFAKDLQEATQDIRDAISQIRNDLPIEMEEPILTRFDPNDFPIVSLALTSQTLTGPELTRIVDPGDHHASCAASAASPRCDVVGGIERELTVELDPQALQAAGVSIGEVVAALQTQNLAAPVGRIERARSPNGRSACAAASTSRPTSPSWWSAQRNGRLIRLGEIAASQRRPPRSRGRSRCYNGARRRRHRHHQVQRLEHHRGQRTRSATRSTPSAPRCRRASSCWWCATPAARHQLGRATSRTRSSRARS